MSPQAATAEHASIPASRRRWGGSMGGLPKSIAVPALVIMLVGAILFTALWGTTPVTVSDTLGYQGPAQDIAKMPIERLHFRTIGYPLVLVMTGSTRTLTPALYFVQLAFHLASTWMLLCLAKRFAASRNTSIALAIVMMSPPLMQKVAIGLTEATCEVLLLAAVLLLVRWTERRRFADALGAGFAFAGAALVRPTYQLLGVVVAAAAVYWLRRRGTPVVPTIRAAAVLLAGSLVLIGGISTFNAVRFGYAGATPMLGWNLTTKTSAFIDHIGDDDPAKQVLIQARNQHRIEDPGGEGSAYVWSVVDQVGAALDMDRAEASSHMLAVNIELIAKRPLDYAASVAEAAGRYLLPGPFGVPGDPGPLVTWIYLVLYMTTFAAFAIQLIGVPVLRFTAPQDQLLVSAWPTWLILTGLVVYTWLVSIMIDVGDARFRSPTEPVILLLIAGGWSVMLKDGGWRGFVRS